jgi:hypothetical protein
MLNFFYVSKVYASIVLFVAVMVIMHQIKPSLIYDNRIGGFRQFGMGYSNKTILPIWLATILLAILCYLFVSVLYSNDALYRYIH